MATETTTTTTRPARKRTTAAKATPAKAAPAAKATEAETELTKIGFSLDEVEPTKNFAKFSAPKSSGCVGSLYVPLGTVEVKVLLIGPAS